MKINWKDFVIAFIIGLILFYVPPYLLKIPIGIVSLLRPGDPVGLIGIFINFAIPLAFYFFRNRCSDSDSLKVSALFGIVALPAYVLLFWFAIFVFVNHLCLDCLLYSSDAPRYEPAYLLPTFPGQIFLMIISLASSLASYLVIFLITHVREIRDFRKNGKMRINRKDLAIALVLGLIVFYVPPSLMGMATGVYSSDLLDPMGVMGLLLAYGIPLAFYLSRNRYSKANSLYFSIFYGIVFLPAYALIYWLPSPAADPSSSLPYWLPDFSGLMSILMISVLSSVLSCVAVLLILYFIQKYMAGKVKGGKKPERLKV